MKKLHVLSLAAAALMGLAACGGNPAQSSEAPSSQAPSSQTPSSEAPSSQAPSSEAPSSEAPSSESKTPIKVGLICLHDDKSTYDANFINALREAVDHLGDKVVFEENCLLTGIEENNDCYTAAIDLVNKGCNVIFADSFGHDSYMLKAAKEHPEVQFCHATGTKSTVNEEVENFHNAFASIYEGRFLAGFAAGLKIYEDVIATKGINPSDFPASKVGYVGAYPYAEVVSGYTSWFLGVRNALRAMGVDGSKITMDVQFTNSWYAPDAEQNAANTLINGGAILVSQHADSMGAPTACELAGVPNVTYNIETIEECEETYLAYSRINWAPYYEAVVNALYNGTDIEGEVAQNWTGSLATGSVEYNVNWANLSADEARLNTYKGMINTVENGLSSGLLKVFNTADFTVNPTYAEAHGIQLDTEGHVTSYLADVIDDGTYAGDTQAIVTDGNVTYFAESTYRSAPYFDIAIDGINA